MASCSASPGSRSRRRTTPTSSLSALIRDATSRPERRGLALDACEAVADLRREEAAPLLPAATALAHAWVRQQLGDGEPATVVIEPRARAGDHTGVGASDDSRLALLHALEAELGHGAGGDGGIAAPLSRARAALDAGDVTAALRAGREAVDEIAAAADWLERATDDDAIDRRHSLRLLLRELDRELLGDTALGAVLALAPDTDPGARAARRGDERHRGRAARARDHRRDRRGRPRRSAAGAAACARSPARRRARRRRRRPRAAARRRAHADGARPARPLAAASRGVGGDDARGRRAPARRARRDHRPAAGVDDDVPRRRLRDRARGIDGAGRRGRVRRLRPPQPRDLARCRSRRRRRGARGGRAGRRARRCAAAGAVATRRIGAARDRPARQPPRAGRVDGEPRGVAGGRVRGDRGRARRARAPRLRRARRLGLARRRRLERARGVRARHPERARRGEQR